jgi:hypothetical protein
MTRAFGRETEMANTAELVQAICELIKATAVPIPITLMNHGVDETAAIIGAVVARSPVEVRTRLNVAGKPVGCP